MCVFSLFVYFWMNSRVLMKMTRWEDVKLIPSIRLLLLSSNVLNSFNSVAVFENLNTSALIWLSYQLDCASVMKKVSQILYVVLLTMVQKLSAQWINFVFMCICWEKLLLAFYLLQTWKQALLAHPAVKHIFRCSWIYCMKLFRTLTD